MILGYAHEKFCHHGGSLLAYYDLLLRIACEHVVSVAVRNAQVKSGLAVYTHVREYRVPCRDFLYRDSVAELTECKR